MSLRLLIEAHFRAFNDDESMTVEDVAEKWEVEQSTARRALEGMVSDGLLCRETIRSPKINRQIASFRLLVKEVA